MLFFTVLDKYLGSSGSLYQTLSSALGRTRSQGHTKFVNTIWVCVQELFFL